MFRWPYQPKLLVAATPLEFRCVSGVSADVPTRPNEVDEPGWHLQAITTDVADGHVVFSGLGAANAAAATAWAIGAEAMTPGCVVNLGIAGALPGSDLRAGDVVIAGESVFYEEGIITPEGFADLESLGFGLVPGSPDWCRGNRLAADPEFFEWMLGALEPLAPRSGVVATVSRCSGTDEAAAQVQSVTGAVAEAMEGAAVLLTARRLGIPAVEVRVISNNCGNRDEQHWDMDRACEVIGEVMKTMQGCL
ncbi:MAG: futalosine hydrolase [Planctomycetes bacterium]|nr:futalosine hydrolase [Planctomycetota bacterium]